ncbi:hypothetical protein M422DRAFT_269916 [Sphaerobolus stellatus SS14]|uniref:F-box domain-containing protein n=1 Tax=Sphaerobolus stellatus (strain SS14) TaxID=990650 RepID=A0A0C9UIP0_SPHS4|nr:hypothetical protein M422DRAFT_269916 [Sphaerobolus stellatus SS14]
MSIQDIPLLNDLINERLSEILFQVLPILPSDLDVVPFVFDRDWQLKKEDPLPVVCRLSRVCTFWRDIIKDMPCAWSTVVIGHGGPIDIPRLEAILAKWAKCAAVDLHIQCHDASQPDFVTHDDSKKNRLEHLAKLLLFRSQIKILYHYCEHSSNCFLPFLFGNGDRISFPWLRSLHIESRKPSIDRQGYRCTEPRSTMSPVFLSSFRIGIHKTILFQGFYA